jgi:hypothetical protein
VASGYALQVAKGDAVLRVLVVVHVASGTLFALAYTVHLIVSVRLARWSAARRLQPEAA